MGRSIRKSSNGYSDHESDFGQDYDADSLIKGYGSVDSGDGSTQLMNIGIYGGGGIYKKLDASIPELKTSGMTEVIVWNIWVKDSGDLNFNMEFPLVEDGKYVGDQTYPDFADAMKSLKGIGSSIRTLSFGIGSSAGDIYLSLIHI